MWNILSHASLDSQATDEGSDAILRLLPFFCKLAFPLTACGIASLLCIFETLTVIWGVGLLWPYLFRVLNSSCVRIPTCFSVWDIFCCNFVIKLLVIFNFFSALSKSPCLRLDPQIKMAILRQQLWTTCSSLGRGGAYRAPPPSMPAFWLGWSCACLVWPQLLRVPECHSRIKPHHFRPTASHCTPSSDSYHSFSHPFTAFHENV